MEFEDEDDEDLLIYQMYRRDYYSSKLGFDLTNSLDLKNEDFMKFVRDYIRMLQWILNYYFLYVIDWDFVYLYHYAPFVIDLCLFTKQFTYSDSSICFQNRNWCNFKIDSKPVLPFVQQLMIMPSDCDYIVPKPYRELMSPSGQLAKYFPIDFETDINGKLASWEAVVVCLISIFSNVYFEFLD